MLAIGLRFGDAEDIVQAAWARLLLQFKKGELSDNQSMPGLAIRQARFLALDFVRKQSKMIENGSGLVGREDLDVTLGSPSPENIILAREQVDRAFSVLSGKSPVSQMVFSLTYLEHKRASDVADEVGLSVQRVRQILCELRRSLDEKWSENE